MVFLGKIGIFHKWLYKEIKNIPTNVGKYLTALKCKHNKMRGEWQWTDLLE